VPGGPCLICALQNSYMIEPQLGSQTAYFPNGNAVDCNDPQGTSGICTPVGNNLLCNANANYDCSTTAVQSEQE
jgi:hypothetical protein